MGFHLEAVDDPLPILALIRNKGVRTCLTINPDIDVHRLDPYLGEVDMVLLMSVFAGFGGQKFIESTLDKVRYVREQIEERHLSTLLEVDGGVNLQNAPVLFDAGADILVAGNAVFKSNDPIDTIHQLKA